MTRPWNAVRSSALPFLVLCAAALLLAAAPRPARAQAGAEYGMTLSKTGSGLTRQRGVTGPEWSPSRAAPTPATTGPRTMGEVRRAREAEATLEVRPPSGAPGKVAGLVYERGTKAPVRGVQLSLVSAEPGYVVTTLTARTDSAGYYEFPAVEPGRWTLAVLRDGLADRYALPRVPPPLVVAKKQAVAAPPFALGLSACVEGHAVWGDGYVLFDAPVTVVPLDTTLAAAGGMVNGVGDYTVCEAPQDSVMVWMHLRDGRSLGRATRLDPGTKRRVDFKPEPLEKIEGAPLRVLPVLADGTPVPRAQVTIVGRRFEQGDRPALVFVREATTDGDGVAEFRAPFGNYEVLAMNPREGQAGSERIVVDLSRGDTQPLRVVLRGANTAGQRAALRTSLLERAEQSLYIWGQ